MYFLSSLYLSIALDAFFLSMDLCIVKNVLRFIKGLLCAQNLYTILNLWNGQDFLDILYLALSIFYLNLSYYLVLHN